MNRNLSLTQILIVFEYLQDTKNPSGIIDNKTDQVIWRNNASQFLMTKWYRQFPKFEIVTNTSNLQNSLNLKKLKKEIMRLTPIKQLPSSRNFEKEYELLLPGIGRITVQDKFYRFLFNYRNYRIFENISASIPRGVIHNN